MTTTRRRRSPLPPPPLPTGAAQETPAPLSGSASPSLTGALEHEVPVAEHEVPVAEHEVPVAEHEVLVTEPVVPEPVPAPIVAESPPAAEPVAEPLPPVPASQPETAEIATVRTRYPHPLFIASQHKVVSPGEEVPVIVDSWVRHHLNHPNGALVRV